MSEKIKRGMRVSYILKAKEILFLSNFTSHKNTTVFLMK